MRASYAKMFQECDQQDAQLAWYVHASHMSTRYRRVMVGPFLWKHEALAYAILCKPEVEPKDCMVSLKERTRSEIVYPFEACTIKRATLPASVTKEQIMEALTTARCIV